LPGRLRAPAAFLAAHGLLEGCHQVYHVAAARRLRLLDILENLLALGLLLLLDQLLQRIDVAVMKLAGIELRGALLDQRRRQVEQVLARLGVGNFAEVALRLANLILVAQRLQNDALAARLERNECLASAHRDLPDADLAALL